MVDTDPYGVTWSHSRGGSDSRANHIPEDSDDDSGPIVNSDGRWKASAEESLKCGRDKRTVMNALRALDLAFVPSSFIRHGRAGFKRKGFEMGVEDYVLYGAYEVARLGLYALVGLTDVIFK